MKWKLTNLFHFRDVMMCSVYVSKTLNSIHGHQITKILLYKIRRIRIAEYTVHMAISISVIATTFIKTNVICTHFLIPLLNNFSGDDCGCNNATCQGGGLH